MPHTADKVDSAILVADPAKLKNLNWDHAISCGAQFGPVLRAALAHCEILLRRSMTVGIGTIASPEARYPVNGRYQRCCGW